MNTQTRIRCEQFIENMNKVKYVFSWDSRLMHLACAGIYTTKGKAVDEQVLKACKNSLKHKVNAFSNFRGTASPPIATMVAISGNPEETLDNGLLVYHLLKDKFFGSTYLPLVAMIIAQLVPTNEYQHIVTRTRTLYERIKSDHPFLTSSKDSPFCALMALSEKSDNVLIRDTEHCYQILKRNFFSSDAVQSLSFVLALCDGEVNEKCERTMELYTKLKSTGHKYGTDYELPTLGILAMSEVGLEETVKEMKEIDEWLSKQKGFGFFSSISKKQRLMYAGILTQKNQLQEDTMQTATINGTISIVIAQEAAMCAAIAASSAAAAASTSSSS
jgi:hypothetical protein